jgi:hypothetical protein
MTESTLHTYSRLLSGEGSVFGEYAAHLWLEIQEVKREERRELNYGELPSSSHFVRFVIL